MVCSRRRFVAIDFVGQQPWRLETFSDTVDWSRSSARQSAAAELADLGAGSSDNLTEPGSGYSVNSGIDIDIEGSSKKKVFAAILESRATKTH